MTVRRELMSSFYFLHLRQRDRFNAACPAACPSPFATTSKLVRPFYIPLARGGPLDAKFEPQLRR